MYVRVLPADGGAAPLAVASGLAVTVAILVIFTRCLWGPGASFGPGSKGTREGARGACELRGGGGGGRERRCLCVAAHGREKPRKLSSKP